MADKLSPKFRINAKPFWWPSAAPSHNEIRQFHYGSTCEFRSYQVLWSQPRFRGGAKARHQNASD
jgi:hypothetical protein